MAAQIRPVDADTDREGLVALFRSCEAKAYQQQGQGLDPDLLAVTLAQRALRAATLNPTWVVVEGDRLTAVSALQTRHWHSEHLGFPVGKVTQLQVARGAEEALRPSLDALEGKAREFSLQHLNVRVDGHDFAAQQALVSRAWYPTGTSVKLATRLDSSDVGGEAQTPLPANLGVRPFQPADRDAVLRVAAEGHEENHLFFDCHLPDEACHAIFRRWVEKCLDGLAAQAWVCDHAGEVAGLCTILDPRDFNEAMGTRIAVLDYIVLDPSVQGQGLGSAFLLAVHGRVAAAGFDQIELRTTATNFAAINLYARHGYRLVGTDQVFGRWLG